MQNPHAGIFGIKSGTFQGFSIFKGSSKPNLIQTIRQSPFSIWDYTFSLRVKVMNVTEHAVCNRDQRYMDTYILLFSCTCARVHFSPVIVQLVKTRFDDNFFLRRVLCSNLKRTCRFFFRKVHAPCNTNLQWRIIWLIISGHTKNIFF